MPRMAASRLIACRASISTRPRLPTTTTRPRGAGLEERAIRGPVRDAERGALGEGHTRGEGIDLRRRADGTLGVRAGAAGFVAVAGDVHAVAGGDVRDLRADRFDLARAI